MRELARALDEYNRIVKLAEGSEYQTPAPSLAIAAGQGLAKAVESFVEQDAEGNAHMYKNRAEAELTEGTRMIVAIDDKSLGTSERIQYAIARAQLGRLAAHLADLCYWPAEAPEEESN